MLSNTLKVLFGLSLLALSMAACETPPSTTGEPGISSSPSPSEHPGGNTTPDITEPNPVGTKDLAILYQNRTLKVSLNYPDGWQRLEDDPESREKFSGPDGFFSIGALPGGDLSVDELARAETDDASQPFGSNPAIESVEVQGREGRLVLPSADQPDLLPGEPAWGMLLVPFPRPVLVDKTLADTFTLYADLDHLRSIAGSLTFEEEPALFPPISDTPAAGICDLAPSNPVILRVTPDMPSPRCMKLQAGHRLILVNGTAESLVVRLAWYEIPLEPGERLLLDVPVGSYLAPGVHHLDLQVNVNSPEIWLLP